MPTYYNDTDPFAAAWLRRLIAAGQLPAGEVDARPIEDVRPDDLRGFDHHHFFAGIGGWALALRQAGWPDAEPVWTGSCPCQPISVAGSRKGATDERHLWPAFWRLIAERRPPAVFGEQVAGSLGRDWLAAVRLDLEHAGYRVGAANLSAAGIGAPHIRQRLFWVGLANPDGKRGRTGDRGGSGGLDNADGAGSQRFGRVESESHPHAEREGIESGGGSPAATSPRVRTGPGGGMGNPRGARRKRRDPAHKGGDLYERASARCRGLGGPGGGLADAARGAARDSRFAWSPTSPVECADGKIRFTQPGIFPLAHGIPGRVGRLRAYGNAIVPQAGAAFIRAARAAREDLI